MLLASCYPIRRVGLLQERSGLPEYEKGEYEYTATGRISAYAIHISVPVRE